MLGEHTEYSTLARRVSEELSKPREEWLRTDSEVDERLALKQSLLQELKNAINSHQDKEEVLRVWERYLETIGSPKSDSEVGKNG